jgi:predicted ATPase
VINLRSKKKPRFFELEMVWNTATESSTSTELRYRVRVVEAKDRASPLIDSERLVSTTGRKKRDLIKTTEKAKTKEDRAGVRLIFPEETRRSQLVLDPDRLALARADRSQADDDMLASIQEFWRRAVFLRLSTNRLAAGSPAKRKSFDPLLDEEGSTLPALLSELNADQKRSLVDRVQRVMQDIVGVEVDRPRASRQENVNYSLNERMPYVGQKGIGTFSIPSWMLSEGTRRITAIFALLVREPPPALLCIEEVENGLDPWTVKAMLASLREASVQGTQVIVTSHSPWLIDHVDINDIIGVERDKGETKYLRFADIEEVQQFSSQVPPGARYVNVG